MKKIIRTFVVLFVVSICLPLCAQPKDVPIARQTILPQEANTFKMPAPFGPYEQGTKIFCGLFQNDKLMLTPTLSGDILGSGEMTKDSTQADVVICYRYSIVATPESSSSYTTIKNAKNLTRHFLVLKPRINIYTTVTNKKPGVQQQFISANNEGLTFYCGLSGGVPTLMDISAIQKSETSMGASSPEALDFYLDAKDPNADHRQRISNEVRNAMAKISEGRYTKMVNVLFKPVIFASWTPTFRMHRFANKKGIATYPEVEQLHEKATALFVEWTKDQKNPEIAVRLKEVAKQYLAFCEANTNKNFSVMCYSNAALAMAMTGDVAYAQQLEKNAQEYTKFFGVTVGETIPNIYKQFDLYDRVANQTVIEL